MRTFFGRRYLRATDAIGRTEKLLGVLVLLLLAAIVAAFAVQVATNEEYLFTVDDAAYRVSERARDVAVAEQTLPSLNDPRWRAPTQVSRYTPDNLYQKINGRADAYLQFHVVGLTFGTYHHRTDADRIVDVYWYDMGEPVNAFGMYRSEAPPDAAPVSIGEDGYETGGAVFFSKGSSYVQVVPTGSEDDDRSIALEIAEHLAGWIEGRADDRWALSALPQQRRVEDSFNYIARDVFGLDFLTEVFTAEYELDDGRITLFIHRAGTASRAKALLDQYVASFEKFGRVIWRDPDASRLIVAGEVAGVIDVVFAKGRYLAGVAEAEDAELGRKAAMAFYEELTLP